MFIKRGDDTQILNIIQSEELTEEQKKKVSKKSASDKKKQKKQAESKDKSN